MAKTLCTFTFPGQTQLDADGNPQPAPDTRKVTVRELTPAEQIQIGKAFDGGAFLQELYKRSLVRCKGQPCTGENRDVIWSALSAKERDLVAKAYRKLHVADETEEKGFFDSEEVVVSE
jgi:hypothetical protein